MKKLLCIILAIVMVFSFAACGKESPEKAADNALKALKTLNIVKMEKYFGELDADEFDLDEISEEEIKLVKNFLSRMSWEILDSVEDEISATVTVRLTTVDLAPIMQELIAELMGDALSSFLGGQMSEEEMKEKALKFLAEKLSEEELEMTTNDIELELLATEKGWMVDTDSIFDGFLGDFDLF